MTEAQLKAIIDKNDTMEKADAVCRLVSERDYLHVNKSSIRNDGATISTSYGSDGKAGNLRVYGSLKKSIEESIALAIEAEIARINKMVAILMGEAQK